MVTIEDGYGARWYNCMRQTAHPEIVTPFPNESTMSNKKRILRLIVLTAALTLLTVLMSQCSDSTSPAPASKIAVVSGDAQYSMKGTTLPAPLVVRVRTDDGSVPENSRVVFSIVAGGGTLESTAVTVDNRGEASTRYTLGLDLGTNIVKAAIEENSSKSVEFNATASNFFCLEQNDTFSVNYATPTTDHHLFIFTKKSNLYPISGSSGIVKLDIFPPSTTSGFASVPGDYIFDSTVYDMAFSARGDLFVARRSLSSEILMIDKFGVVSFFARTDESLPNDDLYVELATNPSGLVIGCDVKGPFVVGCRDTLARFDEATFAGGGINNDALAVDPRRQAENELGEDIYFIDTIGSQLLRLAVDSLSVEESRGLESVASLTVDQAAYARGMASDLDGTIYVLVDGDDTKQLLKYDPAGGLEVIYDFFDRGADEAAGVQRDLVLDRGFGGAGRLYTLDTLNDNMLVYDIQSATLNEMLSDSLTQATLSNRGTDGTLIGGERVGIVVLDYVDGVTH